VNKSYCKIVTTCTAPYQKFCKWFRLNREDPKKELCMFGEMGKECHSIYAAHEQFTSEMEEIRDELAKMGL